MSQCAVRQADLERDRAAIVAVWARNLRSHDEPTHAAKLEWYYLQNPSGRGRLWVLEDRATGRVVGTAGLGMRRLSVGGRSVLAGLASDFAVDQDHRSLGPAITLQKAVLGSLNDGIDLIYGLPNDKSLPVFKRVGYGADFSLSRHVKVLSVRRYLCRSGRMRLARVALGTLADPLVRAGSRESWRRSWGRVVRELDGFDERFNDLWDRTRGSFEVACERPREYLNWRYTKCPLVRYTVLGLLERSGKRLLGYAICKENSDDQVTLIDLWAGADNALRDDLLGVAVRWARRRGAASLACEVAGAGHLATGLARFGFRRRGQGATICIAPPEKVAPSSFYFTLADEDYN